MTNTEANKPKKRKPPRATLEQKIRILDFFHQSGRPQSETVETFKKEVAISTSTFNEWLKHEDEYRERYRESETHFEKHARRKVTYKYDKINRAMDLLVQQRLASNEEITEPILRNYWQIYAHQFGVENPKRLVGFSHGWLSQFKKRHGLSKPRGSDATDVADDTINRTTFNNEKLLADPASDEEPDLLHRRKIPLIKNVELARPDVSEPSSQFEPESTLSFPQNVSYLSPESEESGRNTGSVPEESAESLEAAMQLSLNTQKQFSAGDIERFLTHVADRFFQDHQYDYPQTMHLYKEFRSSFVSERLINRRSAEKRAAELDELSPPSMPKRVHHNPRNDGVSISELLQKDPAQIGVDERLSRARRRQDKQVPLVPSGLDQMDSRNQGSQRDQGIGNMGSIGNMGRIIDRRGSQILDQRVQRGHTLDQRLDQRVEILDKRADQRMVPRMDRDIPQDFISLHQLRPQSRTTSAPIASTGITMNSRDGSRTHTPEDRGGLPHRTHSQHSQHGQHIQHGNRRLQQQNRAQAQMEHEFTPEENTPSVLDEGLGEDLDQGLGEQNVENWLLRQEKSTEYSNGQNWQNSESRKLWEQNKLMLS